MQSLRRNINPFALMLDPQAVIAQIERSEHLEGLNRRICRPLDKPLLGGSAEAADEAANAPEMTEGAEPGEILPPDSDVSAESSDSWDVTVSSRSAILATIGASAGQPLDVTQPSGQAD